MAQIFLVDIALRALQSYGLCFICPDSIRVGDAHMGESSSSHVHVHFVEAFPLKRSLLAEDVLPPNAFRSVLNQTP